MFLAIAEGPGGFQRAVVLKRQPVASADDPELADRVIREATVYARLTHPAIVQLFDLFESDGHVVMVREYVHGLALAELLAELRRRRTRLPDPAAFFLVARVFDALAAAHAARHPLTAEFTPVIHRDVTPGNVLVPWDGYAKLSDFGAAKLLGRTHDTAVGVIKGTLGYLAPEQVLGDPITVRTDVYGAALVAREILTGHEAFPRQGLPELEYLQRMATPRLPPIERARPDLPATVLDALRIALQPDPDRRVMSAVSMVDVLRAACDLERGRRVLVDLLGQIREDFRRGTDESEPTRDGEPIHPSDRVTPRRGVSSPRGALVAQLTPAPTVASVPPPAPALAERRTIRTVRTRRRALTRAVVGALSLLSLCGGYLLGKRLRLLDVVQSEAHVLAEVRRAPVVVAAPAPPPPVPIPKPIAPPDRGYLRTPVAARAHRIFVDGRFACVGGESVLIRCGVHEVKVGSAGKKQRIDVPCGGEVAVAPKW